MPKKILVVDNNPVILKLMENFLAKREGHTVMLAEDGLTALEVLEGFQPEIIFIDLVMPKISGNKLCRILRTMPKMEGVYLVILSAVAVEQGLDFISFGANACIAKGPFKEVESHILTVFDAIDNKCGKLPAEIIGTENVFKRVVTEELLSTNKHFEAALNHMAEGFIELTTGNKIVYINPAAITLLGEAEEKVLSSRMTDFFHKGSRALLEKALTELTDKPTYLGESPPLFIRDCQLAMTLVSVEDRGQDSIIIIIQDITERKTTEQELRQHKYHLQELVKQKTSEISIKHQQLLEEIHERRQTEQQKQKLETELHQTHKMEALGTMAAGIAHDFNNILTAVIGFSELTRRELTDNKQLSSNLDQVIRAGHRAKDLIKLILTFSRQKDHKFLPIRIHIILKEVLKLLRASAQASIEFKEEIDQQCRPVLADTTQIHQIILNICTNAIQSMADNGGKLTVKLRSTTVPVSSSEQGTDTKNFIELSVIDTGVGIDEETIEKIFDPYFTTKTQGDGTGMGLAVVHGIVSGHGGHVTVTSKPGAGSTFSVFMPEAAIQMDEDTAVSNELSRGTESILIVDDEHVIVSVITNILQDLGYQTRGTTDPDEALRIFKQHKDEIDLVIVDQSMPKITGTRLTRELLTISPELPIIICTGYGKDVSADEIKSTGARDILAKPFTFSELATILRAALD